MIEINILTRDENNIFTEDSIYSALICDSDIDGVNQKLAVWQEDSDDVCGILSGGFYFVYQGQPINEYFIEKALTQHDIIIPYEERISEELIRKYYQDYEAYIDHKKKISQKIDCEYPELSKGVQTVFTSDYYVKANLIVGSVNLLRDLYNYLNGFEEDLSNPLISSLIIKGWIVAKGIKSKAVEISDNSPDIWNCGYQKISVVQNYISVVLKDYIDFRTQEGFSDSFAGENPYKGDFAGKKPIWMCWWQGETDMPELIKACVSSVKRNAPANAKVILITLDNVSEYVTFTDSIIDKFNAEIISYTHLSDILRAELVYRYGGMWIDATYYVSHKMDESIFEENLFSIAFSKPLWGMDIMRGRWTLSVLGADKGNAAIQFLMEGLWYYWDKADELIDYFLVDYVFDAGYRHFEDIKNSVDTIRKSSNSVYDLQLKMNQSFYENDLSWLQTASDFYKLNRRNEYVKETVGNRKSFYSYIVNNDCNYELKKADDICINCTTYIELIKNIRAINPKRILDFTGYLLNEGRVSRGIISDFLADDYIVDVNRNININISDYKYIYDSVVEVPDYMSDQVECIIRGCEDGIYLISICGYEDYDLLIVENK